MRFISAKNAGRLQSLPPVSFATALFEGLAPDGDLYVPASMPRWAADDLARLGSMSLVEIGTRMLDPFVGEDVDPETLASILRDALNFPIPLVEVTPGLYALELFHGPTLAFKDVGARVMARLMAALHDGGDPLTILAATSGDTGGAVAHAFHNVPHTRVVILYPKGLVSPTQEAQLTMFNGETANVRAYAVAGSFDDCQRLTKAAFANRNLSRRVRLTSANSINVGRLLPQMIYYAHAVARLNESGAAAGLSDRPALFSTPSGNFGNLTAGVMATRIGIGIRGFVAATNANDVVPAYLANGHFEPRPSVPTIANAMDVGNPSNFDRLMWLFGASLDAMRGQIVGSRHSDDQVRATIREVYQTHGYLLDPHTAIAYLGLVNHPAWGGKDADGGSGAAPAFSRARPGVFLATAHPAKFAEIVEPVIGRSIELPSPLAAALALRRPIMDMEPTLGALQDVVGDEFIRR